MAAKVSPPPAIENAELAARRAERTHIAGCAYRALCCLAQVLFALNGRYLINEKGALAEAAAFPVTVDGLTAAEALIWRQPGLLKTDVLWIREY